MHVKRTDACGRQYRKRKKNPKGKKQQQQQLTSDRTSSAVNGTTPVPVCVASASTPAGGGGSADLRWWRGRSKRQLPQYGNGVGHTLRGIHPLGSKERRHCIRWLEVETSRCTGVG